MSTETDQKWIKAFTEALDSIDAWNASKPKKLAKFATNRDKACYLTGWLKAKITILPTLGD